MRRSVTFPRITAPASSDSKILQVSAAVVWVAFAAIWVLCGALSRPGWATPLQILDTHGQAYYENAYTLIDLPAEDLVKALPELRGLEPAADQQLLPRILSEVGKSAEESYQKFTEIVADEQFTHEQYGPDCRLVTTTHQEFSYLIIPHNEAGFEQADEYRIAANGKPIDSSAVQAPDTEGFASLWALLYPGSQSGSRFRDLGQQRSGESASRVIGFAQRPGWSTFRGKVAWGSQSVLVMYQGVAWIDAATHEILKMRLDLLKPRLDAKLEKQTTEIRFGEVHISDAASSALWVPLQVTVTTAWNGQTLYDRHSYSNYRLPGASTKIKSAPEETGPPPRPN
ncbi:MAG: hypothetical protein ACLQVG_14515 [Terriglobia bacterium]